MSHLLWLNAPRASVQAGELNSTELPITPSEPEAYIGNADDTLAIERAKKHLTLMQNAALTILIPADLLEMQAAIDLFEGKKTAPQLAIDEKKSYGTAKIPDILHDLDNDTDAIGKLIHSFSMPFSTYWDEANKIGTPEGMRHYSAIFKVTDSITAGPIPKVQVTAYNGETTIVKFCSEKGYARFPSMESGNWNFKIEINTYLPNTLTNLGIEDRKSTRLNSSH